MNRSMIINLLGRVLQIEGLLMFLPCLVALCYQEHEGFYYLFVAAGTLFVGGMMSMVKPKSHVFYLKEGCIATALSWVLLSVAGCIPFILTGEIPNFEDALFETVSGFTTTGSSILSDVEALSYCSLAWRSFTHWIGGMGVLVFLLAVIPLSGGANFNLMKAESPGPSVGKLVPKVKSTAQLLYVIYFGITVLEFLLLLLGRMSVFDAMTTAFGTAGTGGFGIKNDSIGSYSPYIQWVVTVFMILFGVNFNAYYYILYRKVRKAFQLEEVRGYFLIIGASVAMITYDLFSHAIRLTDALRTAAFQVGSIITTTGFSTADFDTWSSSSKTILVMLMFCGACAGSTGGGIKVSRIILLIKTVLKEFNSFIHPKSIKKIKVDDKAVEHEVVRSTNVYIMIYIFLFSISVLLISLEGHDTTTNFTAVAATLNNIGPGLSMVGPTQNFGFLNAFSKIVLVFDMLAGRLELFPLLILFHPSIWKELFAQRKSERMNSNRYKEKK